MAGRPSLLFSFVHFLFQSYRSYCWSHNNFNGGGGALTCFIFFLFILFIYLFVYFFFFFLGGGGVGVGVGVGGGRLVGGWGVGGWWGGGGGGDSTLMYFTICCRRILTKVAWSTLNVALVIHVIHWLNLHLEQYVYTSGPYKATLLSAIT